MFARDRQRAGGAERDLFAQHPDRRAANPAPVIGRLENLSEIAAEQEDVLIAVAFDHLEEIVEERTVAGDRQHRLRNGLSNRAEPRALAAGQNHRLPDRRAAHCRIGFWLSQASLLAPDAVRLGRCEKDVVKRACRHMVDDRRAVGVDMVDPASRDGAAKENRKQPIDGLRRARRRLLVSGFGRRDLGLDRFGVRPAAARGLVHAPIVEQLVNDETFEIEAVPVAELFQRPRDRRISPSRERGVAAKKPRPFEMMAGLAYAPMNPFPRIPGAVKILSQDSGPMLKETRGHHAVELGGASEKHFAPRRLEPRQHGLEEMHVRVLFALSRVGRQDAVIASGRRLEVLIENAQCVEGGGEKPRLGRELVSPCEAEQREGMRVKITLRVMHGAVGMNGKDPAVAAIGAMIAVDEPVRGFERHRLALRPPAEQRRMRKDIDLTRLHHGAPRRRVKRRALEGQALDEASARRIESRLAPERQRLLDDPALEARDRAPGIDVIGHDGPSRGGFAAFVRHASMKRASHDGRNTSPTSL